MSLGATEKPAEKPKPAQAPGPPISVAELPPQPPSPRYPGNIPKRKPPLPKSNLGKLPALGSDEWEYEEVVLPPPPPHRNNKK